MYKDTDSITFFKNQETKLQNLMSKGIICSTCASGLHLSML